MLDAVTPMPPLLPYRKVQWDAFLVMQFMRRLTAAVSLNLRKGKEGKGEEGKEKVPAPTARSEEEEDDKASTLLRALF